MGITASLHYGLVIIGSAVGVAPCDACCSVGRCYIALDGMQRIQHPSLQLLLPSFSNSSKETDYQGRLALQSNVRSPYFTPVPQTLRSSFRSPQPHLIDGCTCSRAGQGRAAGACQAQVAATPGKSKHAKTGCKHTGAWAQPACRPALQGKVQTHLQRLPCSQMDQTHPARWQMQAAC